MKSAKRSTALWSQLLPALKAARTSWLACRCGPFLVGVCLDGKRDPSTYVPTTFIHNLARASGHISLAFRGVLPRSPKVPALARTLRVDDDAAARLAARELIDRFPFIGGGFDLAALFARARQYMHQGPWVGQNYVFEDLFTSLVWLGETRRGVAVLEVAERVFASWPPTAKVRLGSDWRARHENLHRSELEAVVHAEVESLGLAGLKDQPLVLGDAFEQEFTRLLEMPTSL